MSAPRTPKVDRDVVGLERTTPPTWLEAARSEAVTAVEPSPFRHEEYANRLRRVRDLMAEQDMPALLVCRPSSIEYLCGYHSAETAPQPLLVTQSATYLYVPDLEIGRALASSWADTILYYGYAQAHKARTLVAEHAAHVLKTDPRIGVESAHTSTPPEMLELLRAQELRLAEGGHLVERVRLVLSAAEIECVEAAGVATQRGVEGAVEAAREPGATDSSLAAAVARRLFEGATAPSAWGPVVATGSRGGIPHSSWKNNPIDDAATLLEFAGAQHRYHAPVMRTLCRGRPSADARRLADLANATLDAVLRTARAGVPCSEVARQAQAATGPLPDDVVFHSLYGYPVGLAHPPHWMDTAPFYITADNHEPLREGMVFHMPGSFRSFGSLGVGLSQTFAIEATGTRVLTRGAAELIEV